MAQTTGFVQTMTLSPTSACTEIGPSPDNTELLTINISTGDDAAAIALKTSMIDALAAAMAVRRAVVANHGDQDAIISQVAIHAI